MAEIVYQTDGWGGVKGAHHIELKVNGKTLMITISDDHVHVIGPTFQDVDARSVNSFYGMLPGGRFKTVQQYHEYVDSGVVPPQADGGAVE